MTRIPFAPRLALPTLRRATSVLSFTFCALVTACGGGGEEPPDAASAATPTELSAAVPAAAVDATVAAAAAHDATALGSAPAALALDAADVAVEARPSKAFADQRWGNVQCVGQIRASQDVPEAGIAGTALPGGTLRFGRVADPDGGAVPAYQFTLDADDPTTASSHRCELALTGGRGMLPRDQVFWHAFAVRLSDQAGTTDEQALAQWHAGDTSGGMLPIYTLLQRGNQLRLVLRYDSSATPARASTTTLTVWRSLGSQAGRWLSFVTQAQLSPRDGSGGFVRTWLDGQRIVDYSGPVGYDQPAASPYVKHGIYHWVDASNPWDLRLPTRSVLQRRPLVVLDPARKYTETSLGAAIGAP